MNTKRIPLALILMLLVCIAAMYFVSTFRPLSSIEKFSQATPTLSAQLAPTGFDGVSLTPLPSLTPTVIPTRTTTESTHGAFATVPSVLRVAELAETPTATLDADAFAATQTSIPALKTFEAIATRAKSTPIAPPLDPARAINKTTNFLLIGTDTRTSDPTWQPNTDVIIVVFVDTANQRASMLSLPRDLVVAIPGQQAFRINSAYRHGWEKDGVEGGVKILKEVLRDDFSIRIDHWALIDFDGLSKIIDTLGGIDVNVPCPLSDTIDDQAFTIPAGTIHMDYVTAKRYVQSRYTTSDTSRNYRQQRVVWAMAKKALSMNAPDRVPALYDELKANVATDMTLLDMVGLIPAVYQLDLQNHPEHLRARVLELPDVYPWISPSGAWLYLPNYELIQKDLDTIFDSPQVAAAQATQAECPSHPVTPPPTDAPSPSPTP